MIARVAVISNVPAIAVAAVIGRLMWRATMGHQAILQDNLSQIPAWQIDEDLTVLHKMTDVLSGRGMQLTVYEVGDMVAFAIE